MQNGIQPLEAQLHTATREANAAQYAYWRAYKLHDVLHVALDTPATVLGEIRVVSFSLGQGAGTSATLALAVLIAHVALRSPSQLAQAWRVMREWKAFGRMAPNHLAFKFEDRWDRPLAEVRREMLAFQAAL